ncbi:hypothetical protein P8452_42109 [Trifolium repens]|nr:hypothetical protein P8452_42109 [Trifolium repens]
MLRPPPPPLAAAGASATTTTLSSPLFAPLFIELQKVLRFKARRLWRTFLREKYHQMSKDLFLNDAILSVI